MERGYFKVWRKIKDSQSYNRSALHRAILLTIFVEANWKSGFFCGRTIAPGQIATSVKGLAEGLREPRTNVQRALRELEKDGVIKLENVGNKWTMITLINWHTYQPQEENCGQPVGDQWLTSGQPVGTIKEGKKERIKDNKDISSEHFSGETPEGGEVDEKPQATAQEKPPRKKREKQIFAEDSFAYKAASYLLEGILNRQPDFKKPDLHEWASHIDAMIRKDDRTEDGIRMVLQKIHSPGYWYAKNILSGRKLREKYDYVMGEITEEKNKAQGRTKQGTTCTGQPRFNGFDHNSERDYTNDPEKLRKMLGDKKYEEIYGNSGGNGLKPAAGQQQ